ncbi:MAG: endolytic transglycosylase MltG [Nocardioides sp.]|uniref:endolytic transglycosylase MltG n=1 Tax=Nocardioides sp. TaxID=35761 RepID=UPI003F036835
MTEYEDTYVEGGRRRARKRRSPVGCVVALLVLALVVGGAWYVVDRGVTWVQDAFGEAADFEGPGSGDVLFEVREGDSATQIGRNLKDAGVVASVDAFIEATRAEPKSSGIQVGFYPLKKEMSAAGALAVLIDPDKQVRASVTIPEGLRVVDIVDVIAKNTDFSAAQVEKALKKDIGLPDYANGNAEGYLFPATYAVTPGQDAADLLRAMVKRWRQAADEADLEARAEELGKTPAEVMIIASLIEAEGRGDDMPKISRVIYNRLDGPGDKGGTNGTLGIDASNAYGLGLSGTTQLTADQLAQDTPYETRRRAGLPPTPIESPGDDAIQAALNPADGPWYYYVTVNLETGETKFSESYEEFLANSREYDAYCDTVDRC